MPKNEQEGRPQEEPTRKRETGRERSKPQPAREEFTVAGERFNILDVLRTGKRLNIDPFDERPGDTEAVAFIRYLAGNGVTPEEYRTAMPRMLEYAVKKEGGREVGFDRDFLLVAQSLMFDTVKKLVEANKEVPGTEEQRAISLSANVYGKMEFMKETFWSDPAQAEFKKRYIAHAEQALKEYAHGGKTWWPSGGSRSLWDLALEQREQERSEQQQASSALRTLRSAWQEIFSRWKR